MLEKIRVKKQHNRKKNFLTASFLEKFDCEFFLFTAKLAVKICCC
jgi:hypothetical protein